MKNLTVLISIGGILFGCWLIFFIVNANSAANLNNRTSMMGFISQKREDTIDRHFIERMIPHHEDAIIMANLALEKSQKPEIKKLAENIIKTQTDEITQMKEWYKEWYRTEVPENNEVMGMYGMMGNNGMHAGMAGDESDIEVLVASPDFDKDFIEIMIPHHQMAVMMANMLKNSTNKVEMKNLADNIISAQTSEINQMRQW